MCWKVVFEDGRTASSRDELEAIIGGSVFLDDEEVPRTDVDHCLCSVDVPGTLCSYNFWVRSAGFPDDWNRWGAEPGDYVAKTVAE